MRCFGMSLFFLTFLFSDQGEKGLWHLFEPMLLTHNHRQGEARLWVERLNRFRMGIVTDEDFKALEERRTDDPHLDFNSMHLSFLNTNVQNHNDKMLEFLKTPLIATQATKVYPKGRTPTIKSGGRIEDLQVLDVLNFKIGARCVMVYNVNIPDGLVNGSTGIIIGVEYKKNNVDCIIVKFDKDTSGQQQRERYPGLTAKYKSQNGTPIFRHEIECTLPTKMGKSLGFGSIAKINQFPLIVNYASTAHKIQVRFFHCHSVCRLVE